LQVVHQFEILTGITPKAFANFSPGFEEREPLDKKFNHHQTLKGFANRLTLSGLSAYL